MSIYRVLDWMRFFEQEFGMGIADFFNAAYPITKLFNQVMERIKSKIFELNFFFFFRNKIVVLNFFGIFFFFQALVKKYLCLHSCQKAQP